MTRHKRETRDHPVSPISRRMQSRGPSSPVPASARQARHRTAQSTAVGQPLQVPFRTATTTVSDSPIDCSKHSKAEIPSARSYSKNMLVVPLPTHLHKLVEGVRSGSTESTLALVSIRSFDINSVVYYKGGWNLLMGAAAMGHPEVTKILLHYGATTSTLAYDNRFSALHLSAQGGHLTVTKILMEAGADLETRSSSFMTPLHMAAINGKSEVMKAMIEAGANINCRDSNNITMLHAASSGGHVDAVKILLRAGLSPSIAAVLQKDGKNLERSLLPLDAATLRGHAGVVRELLQQVGIEGCGGASAGVDALELAVQSEDTQDAMTVLIEAGVVDTGAALRTAASCGREASVKFLLQQQQKRNWIGSGEVSYVDVADEHGRTPLFCGIWSDSFTSSRIVRLLVDAGADTVSTMRLMGVFGTGEYNSTPLDMIAEAMDERVVKGKDATEKQLRTLEAVRRLLLQVAAVHAISWLWPKEIHIHVTVHPVEGKGGRKTTSNLLPLLPILRRRARRCGLVLAALVRYVSCEFDFGLARSVCHEFVALCGVYAYAGWDVVPTLLPLPLRRLIVGVAHDCCIFDGSIAVVWPLLDAS